MVPAKKINALKKKLLNSRTKKGVAILLNFGLICVHVFSETKLTIFNTPESIHRGHGGLHFKKRTRARRRREGKEAEGNAF